MTSEPSRQKSLILIIDDMPKNLQLLGLVLRKINCRIAAAENGKTGLDIARKERPDLILLDVMMPALDGFEVCRRLKSDSVTREIPVIFLTAKTDSDDILEGFRVGAADYVTKPFKPAELLARVNTHLNLKRALNEKERLIEELKDALNHVEELKGMLPICSYCKKIRDDEGYWQKVEDYVSDHSRVKFSHSICPDCVEKHFPDIDHSPEDWRPE